MEIIEVQPTLITVKDENGLRSTVFLQDNGRWKCLRHNRLTCDEVRFVQQASPTLPARMPELTEEEIADLVDG